MAMPETATAAYAELLEKNRRFLWNPFTQMKDYLAEEPVVVERGEGVKLVDVNGVEYYDGNSSLWLNVHGHNRPELNEAVLAPDRAAREDPLRRFRQRLSRRHDRLDERRRHRSVPFRVRPAALPLRARVVPAFLPLRRKRRGVRAGEPRRAGGSTGGARPPDRVPRRRAARPGRSRDADDAVRLPRRPRASLPRARRAVLRGRGGHWLRPHRRALRLPARGRGARHHDPGQGPHRRLPSGRGHAGERRDLRRVLPRLRRAQGALPRSLVHGKPAWLRGCAGKPRPVRAGRAHPSRAGIEPGRGAPARAGRGPSTRG